MMQSGSTGIHWRRYFVKRFCWFSAVVSVLLFLFFCPAPAFAASCAGLHLWFDTLLPTLLPFMILSGILIRADMVRPLASLLSPVFGRLLGISPEGTYAVFMGFLCGCPMGAKILGELLAKGQIQRAEAQYLLSFCNNLSPSFIVTYLLIGQLKSPALILPSILILYGAPILYALCTNPGYRRNKNTGKPEEEMEERPSVSETLSFSMVDSCITDAVLTMVRIGGYVMLFSLLAGIFHLLPVPEHIRAILTALSEITNGIPALVHTFSWPVLYPVLVFFCSLGGFSALAQTDSVLKEKMNDKKNAHLSFGKYVRSRILISMLAFLMALCYISGQLS